MEHLYRIRWADVDANGHMRHSAYADYAADVRMVMFESFGFGLKELNTLKVGPILFREETRYLREVALGDSLRIDCTLRGISEDGRKWSLQQHFYRSHSDSEQLCAVLITEGSFFDLATRKICAPPEALAAALRSKLPRCDGLIDDYNPTR
jgi:acyl-CoA thioester hydrolase